MDLHKAQVSHPSDDRWDDASDHTPVVYKVSDVNIKVGECRITKAMLNNIRKK